MNLETILKEMNEMNEEGNSPTSTKLNKILRINTLALLLHSVVDIITYSL